MIQDTPNYPYNIQYSTSTESDAIANKLIQAIVDLSKYQTSVGDNSTAKHESLRYFRKLLRDYMFEPSDKRSVEV